MKNLLPFFLVCIVSVSCAQTKVIKQAKAYYYIPLPGNIPVDENRNPVELKPDTVLNVYLEISGNSPQWKKAWKQGRSYSIAESIIKDSNLVIGKELNGERSIEMKRSKANKFAVLELQALTKEPAPKKLSDDEILLQGIQDGKIFYYKVKSLQQIASPDFM